MRKVNLFALRTLLISFALVTFIPLAPVKAVEGSFTREDGTQSTIETTSPAPEKNQKDRFLKNAKSPSINAQLIELEKKVIVIEGRLNANEQPSMLNIAWPIWLVGGSSLLALLLAFRASSNIKKQDADIKKQDADINKLKIKNRNLNNQIVHMQMLIEQERVEKQSLAMTALVTKTTSAPPQPSMTIGIPAPVVDPQPAPVFAPAEVNKAGLINTLNAGDRQSLRNAATAELNITSNSENALAMGRAIETELEVVLGGGSYFLVPLQGQHWLFPTDRTLKGFTAAQPAKGLFHFEHQTIAQPQLIEPALLESFGTLWRVNMMGRIATP